jgi:hypothetical protein
MIMGWQLRAAASAGVAGVPVLDTAPFRVRQLGDFGDRSNVSAGSGVFS